MTEPIEVAVTQPPITARPVRVDGGPDRWTTALYPGSLDEARMRLADAVERWIALEPRDNGFAEAWTMMDLRAAEVRRLRAKEMALLVTQDRLRKEAADG